MNNYTYIGKELDLFSEAQNWKAYWLKTIQNFVKGKVLEVGAGIGNNTKLIADLGDISITCLEPDPVVAKQLEETLKKFNLLGKCNIKSVSTIDLLNESNYNTILYIDVLEHIKNEAEELDRASSLIARGGYLIVLSPAFNWIYSPFDKSIGHYRRYNRSMLRKTAPKNLKEIKVQYLDSIGVIASIVNKLLLKQSLPSMKQIKLWDRWFIKVSRYTDVLLCHSFGKTIIGIWQKPM